MESEIETASEAISRTSRAADPEWKKAALRAVEHCATRFDEFTTDQVEYVLASQEVQTREPRALGAVMQEAARRGLVRKRLGVFRKSTLRRNHGRMKQVWRSVR